MHSVISSIRYKSWHQPLAIPYSGTFIENDNLILHYAAHMDLKTLLFKKCWIFEHCWKIGSWAFGNVTLIVPPHSPKPTLNVQWVAFLLVVLFEVILPLHLSSLKASAGELWLVLVLDIKKDIKKLRRTQTRLGSLRYGKDWKNWVYLENETWEYNDSIQTHKR